MNILKRVYNKFLNYFYVPVLVEDLRDGDYFEYNNRPLKVFDVIDGIFNDGQSSELNDFTTLIVDDIYEGLTEIKLVLRSDTIVKAITFD